MRRVLICDLLENGKGNSAIIHDLVLFVPKLQVCTNGTLIHDGHIVEILADDIIIFSANEDGMHFIKMINSTIPQLCSKLQDIRRALTVSYPDITIYNDPLHFESIGNKLQTYNLLKHLPYIPNYAGFSKDMDWTIFPCIVSASRASGGRFRVLCTNKTQLNSEGDRIQRVKGDTFVTEYIDSKIETIGCFHNLRLMVVNDNVIDWFCRPGDNWNIHTRSQNKKSIEKADQWCSQWIDSHEDVLAKFVSDLYDVLGKGAYSYDAIIVDDRLYLCEVGYKFWDDTVAKLINIKKPTKHCDTYKKLLKSYIV